MCVYTFIFVFLFQSKGNKGGELQKFCVQFRQSRVTAHERLWDSLKVRLQQQFEFYQQHRERERKESIIIAVVRDVVYVPVYIVNSPDYTHTNIHNNARQERREKLV